MHKARGTGGAIRVQFPDWTSLHPHRVPSTGEGISNSGTAALRAVKQPAHLARKLVGPSWHHCYQTKIQTAKLEAWEIPNKSGITNSMDWVQPKYPLPSAPNSDLKIIHDGHCTYNSKFHTLNIPSNKASFPFSGLQRWSEQLRASPAPLRAISSPLSWLTCTQGRPNIQ